MAPRESDRNQESPRAPDNATPATGRDFKKVVVVGSGPAGLMSALYILRRNYLNMTKQLKYHVTLIDREKNYISREDDDDDDNDTDEEDGSLRIGLTAYAIDAIRTFPRLYEDYISKIYMERKNATVGQTFESLLSLSLSQEERAKSGFMVSRKAVAIALAQYLHDVYVEPEAKGGLASFRTYFNTEPIFVNDDYKYVMIRNLNESKNDNETHGYSTVDYDILIGCDGVHAFVRNMFQDIHPKFQFALCEKKGIARTMTLGTPRNSEGSFMTFIKNMPNVTSAIFPDDDGGDRLHLTCGYESDRPCDPELESDDVAVVSAYFEKHFKQFAMNWEEVGHAWVDQRPFTTAMMSCNYFHSLKMNAVLLGEEASMTIPNIGTGNGMNRTLIDARMLDVYLNKHEDNINMALPAYSIARERQVSPLRDWFASL